MAHPFLIFLSSPFVIVGVFVISATMLCMGKMLSINIQLKSRLTAAAALLTILAVAGMTLRIPSLQYYVYFNSDPSALVRCWRGAAKTLNSSSAPASELDQSRVNEDICISIIMNAQRANTEVGDYLYRQVSDQLRAMKDKGKLIR